MPHQSSHPEGDTSQALAVSVQGLGRLCYGPRLHLLTSPVLGREACRKHAGPFLSQALLSGCHVLSLMSQLFGRRPTSHHEARVWIPCCLRRWRQLRWSLAQGGRSTLPVSWGCTARERTALAGGRTKECGNSGRGAGQGWALSHLETSRSRPEQCKEKKNSDALT